MGKITDVRMSVDDGTNGHYEKHKCYKHNFYTDDDKEYFEHRTDPTLSHVEGVGNVTCFHCGKRIDDNGENKIEYRHLAAGMATHMECRKKMAQELNVQVNDPAG